MLGPVSNKKTNQLLCAVD